MSYATVALAIFSKTELREHPLKVFTCEQVQNLLSFKETGQELPQIVRYALRLVQTALVAGHIPLEP